jgi:hypothetical protein
MVGREIAGKVAILCSRAAYFASPGSSPMY